MTDAERAKKSLHNYKTSTGKNSRLLIRCVLAGVLL